MVASIAATIAIGWVWTTRTAEAPPSTFFSFTSTPIVLGLYAVIGLVTELRAEKLRATASLPDPI